MNGQIWNDCVDICRSIGQTTYTQQFCHEHGQANKQKDEDSGDALLTWEQKENGEEVPETSSSTMDMNALTRLHWIKFSKQHAYCKKYGKVQK